MTAPIYDWTCQQCGKGNRAHTSLCADCGFVAYFKADDLPAPVCASDVEVAQDSEPRAINLWVLFPEGLLVLPLALYTPYWALRAFAQGDVLAPLTALLVEAACVTCFVAAMRAGLSWVALGCMVIFLWLCFTIGVFG